MRADGFVDALSALTFEHVFNPYSEACAVHDYPDAPRRRSHVLLAVIEAAANSDIDAIWIGRDLGYRGGRRTGLALTDDVHINAHTMRWGFSGERPTRGEAVAERTAAVIWNALEKIDAPIFLWNVFPLHPHLPDEPFSNRLHNADERKAGEEILSELIDLLRPHRLIAIGNDARHSASRLSGKLEIFQVRHPSYGGQTQFNQEIYRLYDLR